MKRIPMPWPMLGDPNGTIPNLPSPEGAELGSRLARFCEQELAKQPGARQPCDDCAFRRGTIPNQCAGTLMDAFKCLTEGHAFHCHQGSEPVCAGYLALMRAGKND